MLQMLRGKATDRKLWLYGSACLRRVWSLLEGEIGERTRQVVEVVERHADGIVAFEDSEEAYLEYVDAFEAADRASGDAADYAGAHHARVSGEDYYVGWDAERPKQAHLLRDIFGNPFRPLPPLPGAIQAWNDGTVVKIAQGAYEERAFDRLPILADALLDAGCADEDILAHCRSAAPHVRGCWVVDLILGKS
jgi:hypothetical protein